MPHQLAHSVQDPYQMRVELVAAYRFVADLRRFRNAKAVAEPCGSTEGLPRSSLIARPCQRYHLRLEQGPSQ